MNRIAKAAFAVFALLACASATAAPPAPRKNEAEVKRILKQPVAYPFTVVIMGDNRDSKTVFPKLLESADALRPAFIVNNGDVVYSGKDAEYPLYLEQTAKVKGPFISVIGNHEIHVPDGAERFRGMYGATQFAFSYGGWKFIVLDTSAGKLDAAALAWLETQLKSAPGKAVVMTHMPPVQKLWYQSFKEGAPEFEALLKKHKSPIAVFSHMHAYDRLVKDGIPYIVTGGAGAEFGFDDKMNKLYLKEGGNFFHYIVLVFTKDTVQDYLVRPFGLEEPAAAKK